MNTTVIEEIKRLEKNRMKRRQEKFAAMAHLLRTDPLVKPNPHLTRLLAMLDKLSEDRDGATIQSAE